MTGQPQLDERQETLLRQAKNCIDTAEAIRKSDHYDQNDYNHCIIAHAISLDIFSGFVVSSATTRNDIKAFGVDTWVDYFGEKVNVTAHDGTKEGAVKWLEDHATKLIAQI